MCLTLAFFPLHISADLLAQELVGMSIDQGKGEATHIYCSLMIIFGVSLITRMTSDNHHYTL